MRATYRAAVYVIPKRGDEILLFRRFNTGFGDGQYSFPAGHVEEGESVTATAIREALEEAGIGLTWMTWTLPTSCTGTARMAWSISIFLCGGAVAR